MIFELTDSIGGFAPLPGIGAEVRAEPEDEPEVEPGFGLADEKSGTLAEVTGKGESILPTEGIRAVAGLYNGVVASGLLEGTWDEETVAAAAAPPPRAKIGTNLLGFGPPAASSKPDLISSIDRISFPPVWEVGAMMFFRDSETPPTISFPPPTLLRSDAARGSEDASTWPFACP